jgi:hypothetical protein
MSSHTETIYVPLLNEGTDVWRPVLAFRRADELFEIASKNDDPEDEVWGFSSGSLVRCEPRQLSGGVRLVAIELHSPCTPRVVQS